MAEDDDDEAWTFDVQGVSRIDPDVADEDGITVFHVTFDVDGPNASAEIQIFVPDVRDPTQIIILALAQLHRALSTWARITAGRRVANDDGEG